MRKLNDKQKEQIKKEYGRLGFIIIMNVQDKGNDKNDLQVDINDAYDLMIEQGE